MPGLFRILTIVAAVVSLLPCMAWAQSVLPDQYQGDTAIYSGLPTTADIPNVLIIVDNSRATLEKAPGQPYNPGIIYTPLSTPYQPWYIYNIDNQGDVANLPVVINATEQLENLTCTANDDVIRKTLLLRGTYSSAGTAAYPNIKAGACDVTSKGSVYVLGNYLNYTLTEEVLGGSEDLPAECLAPPPLVSVVINVPGVCSNTNKDGSCKIWKSEPYTQTVYFQLRQTHTSDDSNKPGGTNDSWANYWQQLAPGSTYTAKPWASGTEYKLPMDQEICRSDDLATQLGLTQREIIYRALEQAVGGALGSVRFAAMSYGTNNQGASVLYPMTDLSKDLSAEKTVAPDCSITTNKSLEFCKFLAALPGVRKDLAATGPFTSCTSFNGADCVASNTARPQAEALFDAGYYLGANYTSITNKQRIAEDDKSLCNLNHVVLLTNGFTNGDNSPNLKVIGDYDQDSWPNEEVYGLGSHMLDDVAKYLNDKLEVRTHVVLAFQESDPLLVNASTVDGKGKFYQAYSAQKLAAALTELFASILNDANTSFVAPVVPASTTNRTVSGNKVYLGLFRPQETGAWHGNIKKYALDTTGDPTKKNRLLAANGNVATYLDGTFDPHQISYWSLDANGLVPAAGNDIDPSTTDVNAPKGDGGRVDAGGAGGVLLRKVETLAAAIRGQNTWTPNGVNWRTIYTNLPGNNSTMIEFSLDNEEITPAMLGLASEPKKRDLIRRVHGFRANELELTSEAAARDWIFGDVLHSRPLVFNYSSYAPAHENLCTPGADGKYNTSVIYVGANDGMLHAINDCDGSERWAFIPQELLARLQYQETPLIPGSHQTYVDGAPSAFVHDANADGVIDSATDAVVLVFGLRRGGGVADLGASGSRGSYFAIDVTDPDAPQLLWRFDGAIAPELGETWAQPRIAKVPVLGDAGKADPNSFKVVAFLAGGYDNNEDLRYGNTMNFQCDSSNADVAPCNNTNKADRGGSVDGSGTPETSPGSVTPDNRLGARGRGLYAVEIATMTRTGVSSQFTPSLSTDSANPYWSYTATQNGSLDYSFASDLTLLDMNSDGLSDRIYVSDTGGHLWRFDLSSPNKDNWSGEVIFKANPGYACEYGLSDSCSSTADGTTGRKVFYRPIVTVVGVPHIYFGTGDREHPLNIAGTDRMYCIIDWGQTTGMGIDETRLVDVTENKLQDPDATEGVVQSITDRLYAYPAANTTLSDVANSNLSYGWYIRLDGKDRKSTGDPGEKVLAPATVFNGQVFFSTYQLKTGVEASCEPGNLGISRLYQLNYKTGEAVVDNDKLNNLNSTDAAPVNDRAVGGAEGELLLRSDRVRVLGEGIPSGIVTLLDASGKVTLLISSSDKVEASGLPDVKLIMPVYWMQW